VGGGRRCGGSGGGGGCKGKSVRVENDALGCVQKQTLVGDLSKTEQVARAAIRSR